MKQLPEVAVMVAEEAEAEEAALEAAGMVAEAPALDFLVAISDKLSAPAMLVPSKASKQCLGSRMAHVFTGMSVIRESIIAGFSSIAATMATITTVIRSGMDTSG